MNDEESKLADFILDEIERRIEELEKNEDAYNDWLDSTSVDVQVGNSTFQSSLALKELDLMAYNAGKSDFIESVRDGIEEEVRNEIDQVESLKAGEFVKSKNSVVQV